MIKRYLIFLVTFIAYSINWANIGYAEKEYEIVEAPYKEKIECMKHIGILVEVNMPKGKSNFGSEKDIEEFKIVSETAIEGAVRNTIKMKGYKCIFCKGTLSQAYKQAQEAGCDGLIYAMFECTRSAVYCDRDAIKFNIPRAHLPNVQRKSGYIEGVFSIIGSFDLKEIKTKETLFKVKCKGHPKLTVQTKDYCTSIPLYTEADEDAVFVESEIPFIYRLTEESFMEFPQEKKGLNK